ncbi:transmembrane protein 17-like isoform X1 [Chamaea fasciata]|uniref:transmembrane protein 17-like isoform X1 n=1 Tax=Chamaea fasciata TaxID=190680 RepID=UPI00336A1410
MLQSAVHGTQGLLLPSASCEGGPSGQGDPGAVEQPAHPCLSCLAHEVLSSLPLQMTLYFNVYYFPVWCLAEGIMLHLKYHLLPWHYQFLLVTAFLILSLVEGSRLYLGYLGNLQEKVPELAGFLLLSFLIQLPLLLFLLTDSQVIHLPLEVPMHSLFLAFLLLEIVAAFLALRTMTKQLAAQFYLRQFQEGGRGQLEPGLTGGQAAKMR